MGNWYGSRWLWIAVPVVGVACGESSSDADGAAGGKAGNAGGGSTSVAGGDTSGVAGQSEGGAPAAAGGAFAGAGGGSAGEAGGGGDGAFSCEEAAMRRTHVGCEFWPTLVANPVLVAFTPAVVMANDNDGEVEVTVTGPAGFVEEITIPAHDAATVRLEWQPELKGPEWSYETVYTSGGRLTESALVEGAAFKVVSSQPISAWQFSPLDYDQDPDPPGCEGCVSASSGASLLMPVTSLTGNYRVFTYALDNEGSNFGTVPGGVAITATVDGTSVDVRLAAGCGAEIEGSNDLGPCVAAGPGVESKGGGELYAFQLNAGDVVQLVGSWSQSAYHRNADVSGSLIFASQRVQVIAFNAVANVPDGSDSNADHMEEVLLPVEALTKRYIVVPPTDPAGGSSGHVVRIYGSVDNTQLIYSPSKPAGAPDLINAGEVVQLPPPPLAGLLCSSADDQCITNSVFTVEGTEPFGVVSFMVGGELMAPDNDFEGDPAACSLVGPEQFLPQYSFFAPPGYLHQFIDILHPRDGSLSLDGLPYQATAEIIDTDWELLRVPITSGLHNVSTSSESGMFVRVVGHGTSTGYCYPAGAAALLYSAPPGPFDY